MPQIAALPLESAYWSPSTFGPDTEIYLKLEDGDSIGIKISGIKVEIFPSAGTYHANTVTYYHNEVPGVIEFRNNWFSTNAVEFTSP